MQRPRNLLTVPNGSVFRIFFPAGRIEIAPLTLAVILAATVVSILCGFGRVEDMRSNFTITRLTRSDSMVSWAHDLPEVRHGQVWRLLTPALTHMSLEHLAGNCIWFAILGTMIERRQRSRVFAGLFLGFATVLDRFAFYTSGPNAAGLSAVVFALFGVSGQ